MSRGKNIRELMGIQGLVSSVDMPDWGFIYDVSTVKHPNYNVGDSIDLPDGRGYRYGLSTSALATNLGCQFESSGLIAITTASTAAAIGDKKVVVPAATHAALAKDELRGGYIIIYLNGPAQFRGIIGNDASVSAAAVTIYLDGPLTIAVTTSSKFEVFGNPWRYLVQTAGNPNGNGFAGPPAATVSAAAMYFWCQTKGPTNLAVQSTLTGTNEATAGMWRGDGSIEAIATALGATIPTDDTSQYAGYRMGGNYTDNGPLFMLQG
ncbi:MAG: hypothetical protein IMZ53_02905 [Thermoplasmata archaeon]|nr:hypothetical protein [Thermoplasmata archaeon]